MIKEHAHENNTHAYSRDASIIGESPDLVGALTGDCEAVGCG